MSWCVFRLLPVFGLLAFTSRLCFRPDFCWPLSKPDRVFVLFLCVCMLKAGKKTGNFYQTVGFVMVTLINTHRLYQTRFNMENSVEYDIFCTLAEMTDAALNQYSRRQDITVYFYMPQWTYGITTVMYFKLCMQQLHTVLCILGRILLSSWTEEAVKDSCGCRRWSWRAVIKPRHESLSRAPPSNQFLAALLVPHPRLTVQPWESGWSVDPCCSFCFLPVSLPAG